MPIVGLKSLQLRSSRGAVGQPIVSTGIRPTKKRVFTEDEWAYLHQQTTEDLYRRIFQGDQLIELLHRPEMLNISNGEAAKVASNLKYQQDAIRQIIAGRTKELKNGRR